MRCENCETKDAEIARLHRFVVDVANRLALASEVLSHLAEKKKPFPLLGTAIADPGDPTWSGRKTPNR